MKKYILFFLSIVLLLGTVLVYNTINTEKSRESTFSEAGYILNNLSDRYYFYEEETYSKSYDNKIVFNDTEGAKVTIGQENFIHYSSGAIEALKESVLLDLNNINEDPIVYYNISSNKEIKKVSNRYTIKNLKSDIQFDKAIWKISDNKYIILATDIKITLSSGTEKEIEDYIEIEYSDNEIVNLYNQEVSMQTISSDSYIQLPDNIKINLGTKIVSANDEIKMSLENMVINSNDNVKLVDLEEFEPKEEENTTGNNVGDQNGSGQQGGSTTITNNSEVNGSTEEIEIDEFEPTDIEFNKNTDEEEVDESKTLSEPIFKVEKMEVSATTITAKVNITDNDDLLSKDDTINVQIRNDVNGKIVQSDAIEYGDFDFDVYTERLLPGTQYSLIVSAKYIMDETIFSKNFVYKTFATPDIGVDIVKDGFTDDSMSFEVKFDEDTLSESAVIRIYNMNDEEVKDGITIAKNNANKTVTFNGLESNTTYKIRICDIMYEGAVRKQDNLENSYWIKSYEYTTLKKKIDFNTSTYIDKRNGNFNLYIENVSDIDNAIQNYEYFLYEKINDNTIAEQPSYRMKSQNTEEIVKVSFDSAEDAKVFKNKYYHLKVVATMYDNEKYIEIEKNSDAILIMSDKQFPIVEWRPQEVTATSIVGDLCIIDDNNAIDLSDNIIVKYKNSLGENEIYVNSKYERTGNEIVIHVDLNNLKATETYVFSTTATVDLGEKDENGDAIIRKDTSLGDVRVTTTAYQKLRAVYRNVSGDDANKQNVFTANLRLLTQDEDNQESVENLTSMKLLMQAGSSYNPSNVTQSITITEETYRDYEDKSNPAVSFEDFITNKGINITPSLIGGGEEENYKENYYIIGVTATIDGTPYSNHIPLMVEGVTEEDKNSVTDAISYEDTKKNITYTAAWMKMKGQDTQSSDGLGADVVSITNKQVDAEHHNSDLKDDTVVAFRVKANFNPGTTETKSIIYKAWRASTKQTVKDSEGNDLVITMDYTNPNNIPEAVFYLESGDGYGKGSTGLYRGYSYYFTYTVVEKSENTVFNDEHESKSAIALLEKPTLIMYPVSSARSTEDTTKGTMTYKYSCHDPDFAIIKDNTDNEVKFTLASGAETTRHIFKREANNENIVFNNLIKEYDYTLKYTYHESYGVGSVSEKTIELGTVKFRDIITINQNTVSYSVSTTTETNVIHMNFTNKDEDNDVLSKVVAVDVNFVVGDQTISYNKMILKESGTENNKRYSLQFDLLEDANSRLASLIGNDYTVTVKFYYDSGIVGFNPSYSSGEKKYAVFMNDNDDYLKLYSTTWQVADTAKGNMYEVTSEFNSSNVKLTLKDLSNKTATRVLNYTPFGLEYAAESKINQRKISTATLSRSVNDNVSIIPGIKVKDLSVALTSVDFNVEVTGPNRQEHLQNIVFEVYPVDPTDPDREIDVNNVIVYDNNESTDNRKYTIQDGKFVLSGLNSRSFYKMKIRYGIDEDGQAQYFYDRTNRRVGYEYEFNTGASISMKNVSIVYSASKYGARNVAISYKIGEGEYNLYEKMEYILYYKDATGQRVDVYDRKIDNDKQDSSTNRSHTIGIGPKNNDLSARNHILEYGKKYYLEMIPIVTVNDLDETLDSITKDFTLEQLSNIQNGARATRYDADNEKYFANTIGINITIKDKDKVIADTVNKQNVDSTGLGKYKLAAYYVDDYGNKQESIKIYTAPAGSSQISTSTISEITNSVLNIRDNASNYPIYLYGVDFTRSCIVEYIMDTNTTNDPSDVVTNTIQCCKIDGVKNAANIDIGNHTASNYDIQGTNKYGLRMEFYDSYHITDVNMIQFTIYEYIESGLNFVESGVSKVDQWQNTSEGDGFGYYSLNLPLSLDKTKTYMISLNLYNTDWNINYPNNMDRIKNSRFGDTIELFHSYGN